MKDADLRSLHGVMVQKLVNCWTISPVARALGVALSEESFAQGHEEVEILQRELCVLTGYAESDISKGVMELRNVGVLHRRGRQGKPQIFRLLPKAELVEPQPRVDAAEVLKVRDEVRARNLRRRPGDDPGGQAVERVWLPTEERLAGDLASGSASRALSDVQTNPASGGLRAAVEAQMRENMRGPELSQQESTGRNFPPRKVPELSPGESTGGNLPARKVADGRAYARAPETLTCTSTIQDVNVVGSDGVTKTKERVCAPVLPARGDPAMATRALRAVWQVVPKAEFDPWQRRWTERCRAEPDLVLGFAEDCADRLQRGEEIGKPGAWIFGSVKNSEALEGRPWR